MKRVKITVILMMLCLTLVVCAVSISGCNKTDPNTIIVAVVRDQSSAGAQKAQEKCLEEYARAFTLHNPDLQVQYEYLNVLPAKTDGYDCILASGDDVLRYIAGDLVDLTQYMKENDVDEAQLLPSALDIGRFANKNGEKYAIYYMPFNYDRTVIYADTSLFLQAGVEIPSINGWTYSEFLETLEQLYYSTNDIRYTGIYMPYYMPYVWQYYCNMFGGGWNNGKSITMDTGETYNALLKMLDVYNLGLARSYQIDQKGSAKAACAMSMTYACMPWYDGITNETLELTKANPGKNTEALLEAGTLKLLPLPAGDDGKVTGNANTRFIKGFSVLKGSEKKDLAAVFALFSVSDEGQKILNDYYGGIPVKKALWEQDFWKKGLLAGDNAKAVLYGIDYDVRDDFVQVLDGDADVYNKNIRLRTIFSALMQRDFGESNDSERAFKIYIKDFCLEAEMTIDGFSASVS